MTSSINTAHPAQGTASTANVRSNFTNAKAEINDLQRSGIDVVAATGTDTYAANFTNDITLVEGRRILVEFTNANTLTGASVTLNADSTGAKQIVDRNGDDLAAGDIEAGAYIDLVYDATGTEWVALSVDTQTQTNTTAIAALGDQFTVTTGTFTPTWTGFSVDPTIVVRWTKYEPAVAGDALVTLSWDSGVATGTSNSTSMSFSGVPAAVTPTLANVSVNINLRDDADSGQGMSGTMVINTSSGATFYAGVVTGSVVAFSSSGFTASGTKGLQQMNSFATYSVPS